MTIKELKEKIKENPNKLHSVEKDLIDNMDFLELFNQKGVMPYAEILSKLS